MKRSLPGLCLRWLPLALGVLLFAPPARAQGGDVGEQMERTYGVVSRSSREGRRLNDQLDRVVERIVAGVNSTAEGGDFRLRSAKILGGREAKYDRQVNAFALPDGRIYVTLGLMRMIQRSPRADDELAFVVGHEVTHVAERHSEHQMKKSLPVTALAILLGAVSKNRTVGELGRLGAAAYSSSFSRKDEYRADKGGLMAMRAAGYDLQASVRMLKRLRGEGGEPNSLVNGWFGSHPLTTNRINRVREMIREIGDGRRPRDRSEEELEREDRRR